MDFLVLFGVVCLLLAIGILVIGWVKSGTKPRYHLSASRWRKH